MNKQIVKYISIVVSFIFLAIFIWLLFIYVFVASELKKTIYPVIENSKQLLSEVITKDFATDKIQRLIVELEKKQYISSVNVINEKNSIFKKKVNSLILSLIKISYKIKKDKKTVGYIEIFPSYELLEKIFYNGPNIVIVIASIVLLLCVIAFLVFIYTQRFVFYPYKQIKTVINNIISNESISVIDTTEYGIWNNIFLNLKKLNNKVFNIDTTMELLSFTSSIVKSKLELVNLIQMIFNIIQKKFRSSMCALLLYDESGQLRIIAKNTFVSNDNSSFVTNNPKNYIWKSYAGNQEIIVNSKKNISKEILGELYVEGISSFMSIPLVDNDKKCIGVFAVANKVENSFDSDVIEIVRSSSKYIVLLVNRMNDYKKIKKINKDLETEKNSLIKEMTEMNNILINKEKIIKSIIEMSKYISEGRNIADIINYMSDKLKEILKIEKFGILTYDNDKNLLNSIKGSFDTSKDLQIKCKKDTIYSKIIDSGKYVILNDDVDLSKYSDIFLCDDIKFKSAIFVPIKKKDKVFAIMVAINKVDGKFVYSDVKNLDYIATINYAIINKIIENKR